MSLIRTNVTGMRFRSQSNTFKLTAVGWLLCLLWLSTSLLAADELREKGSQAASSAEASSEKQAVTAEQIQSWIGGLSSESFQVRRASFVELLKAGDVALPAIETAKQSTDIQLAEVAFTLEILIRSGVAVDHPDEASEFLYKLNSDPESAMTELCEKGYWSAADQLLASNELLKESLRDSPYAFARLSRLVDKAMEQGDPKLAWPIIRQSMSSAQAALISRQTGYELGESDDKPESECYRAFIQGDMPKLLSTKASTQLKCDLALRAANWSVLRDPAFRQVIVGNSTHQLSSTAMDAVLLEFGGDLETSKALWDNLLQRFQAKPNEPDAKQADGNADALEGLQNVPMQMMLKSLESDPRSLRCMLLAMLMSGRAQEVQDFLVANSADEGANWDDGWSFALRRGDYDTAFQALGIQADFKDFDKWIIERRTRLHREAGSFFNTPLHIQQITQLAVTLMGLGKRDEASAVIDMLVAVCQASRQNESQNWRTFARGMARADARVKFLEIFRANFDRMSDEARSSVLTILYPECSNVIRALLDTAPELNDPDGRPSKWAALEQLWLFNRSAFEPDSAKILRSWLNATRKRLNDEAGLGAGHLEELSQLAKGVGLLDLSLEFATEAGVGGSELWVTAARLYMERSRLDAALSYLKLVREIDSSQNDSIVDEAAAMIMSGKVTEALALEKSRWLRPLQAYSSGPSLYGCAVRLKQAGRLELALEYMQAAYQLIGTESNSRKDNSVQGFYYITLQYADLADDLEDHERSANLRRGLLIYLLKEEMLSIGYNYALTFAEHERVHRAVLAAKTSDMETFKRCVEVAENLVPHGIELVEDTYQPLVKAGHQDVADELFQRFDKRMLEHLEKWPEDATSHNNLAWMYARCDQKLEEALKHAELAVSLSPYSPILLDTLAEVYFRLGKKSQAIEAMYHCIELDPREAHYRKQLTRFLDPVTEISR